MKRPDRTEKVMRRPGLKLRIIGYMGIFCAVAIVLLWLFQVVFLDDVYKSIKQNEVARSARSIVRNIDHSDLDSLLARIAQENEICIRITDLDGNELYSAHTLNDCILHRVDSDTLRNFYNVAVTNGGEVTRSIPRRGFFNDRYDPDKYGGNVPGEDNGMGESILSTVIVPSKAVGDNVVLYLNATTSPVTATVKTLRSELIIITAVLLMFAVLLSFVMAKQISAPITEMSKGARRLAAGNYTADFNGRGYKESEMLADSLNYAATELSKTDKLQKELIANISHDLRTPLTMISGYAEMMKDIPGEMNSENIDVIIGEAKRLTSLVNDVMDLSKLGANVEQLNKEEFNLTKAVEESIDRLRRMSACDGYDITFESDSDAIVYADRTRILQVVYNLLINAINHTGEDKRVIVRQLIHPSAHSVRIEVTDTGEGIAEEELPYIWDRYYKVDKVHKRSNIGSGLGLSIVRGILELHKAKYGVESRLGCGSTFWFELS